MGDVLVTKSSGSQAHIGKSTLVTEEIDSLGAAYSNFMQRLRPAKSLDSKYLYYLLQSDWSRQQLALYATTTTGLANITGSQLGAIRLDDISICEQRAIADYLDRETARIDAFIAKNEELVRLLTERRAAVLARALLKGVARDVDLFDSRWFGKIPAHWKQLPVKGIASRVTDGAHVSPETENGQFDFVSTRDITSGTIDFEGSLKTSPETYSYLVRTGCQPHEGDVLYSKDGTIGETAVVTESRDFVVASSLIIITPNPHWITPRYLRYALSSVPLLEQARTLVRGAGLPRISIANLATVVLPVPPLHEQERIVNHIETITSAIDSATDTARRCIGLARERRTALISAAVTGKIDVGVAA